ncbi:hypothetical protein ACQ4PT_044421 [Festuca glaucescens]
MVPLPGSPQVPCFQQCVEWILQNQQRNGSWGLNHLDSTVNKDLLSSTLACVLALKKWSVGREHIRRGLHFIGSNFTLAMDEQTASPIGFNITFAAMVSLAIEMGLEFPVRQAHVDGILHFRDMELERLVRDKSYGREAYMAYVAEGLGNLLDWNEVMKFQRKNGSLFNSPSSTAAALVYNYDDKALQYLNFLVSRFVPTVYPTSIYCQLLMVDSLEKMGISQHFYNEIKGILDVTYSLWLQRDEEITLDVTTSAMAFRHLRMNGYDVSPDQLSHVVEISNFRNSLQGYLNDTKSILELYKASKVSVSENEFLLDDIAYWSGSLLTEKFLSDGGKTRPIFREVEYTLKFPFYATMERLDHKRNIEYFDARGSQMLKTEYVWDEHSKDDFYSEQVKILFYATYTTVNQLGTMASEVQNRDWLQLLRSMMTEAEWRMRRYVPTVEEYMSNAVVSFALGPIVLIALYFVKKRLLGSIVNDCEYNALFRLMSTCGRLLNDIQGFEVFWPLYA